MYIREYSLNYMSYPVLLMYLILLLLHTICMYVVKGNERIRVRQQHILWKKKRKKYKISNETRIRDKDN